MAGHFLAWLLLVTYVIVTCFTGGATIWTFIGMQHNETDNSISKGKVEPTRRSNWYEDPYRFTDDEGGSFDDLFMITPSGTSAVVALLITVIGVCSRSIFRTTQAIHGSLGMVIVHITMLVLLLLRWKAPDNFQWMISVNVAVIVMCSLQVVVGVAYLKWQKNTWITLNFKQLFTMNSCFFIGRLVVAAFLIDESLSRLYLFDPRNCPDIDNCPSWAFYFSAIAIITGIVLNVQCILSVYFGSVHRFFVLLSTLILTVGYGCLSVLVSPLYVYSIYKERLHIEFLLIYSAILFSLHLIHLILLGVAPNGLTYSLFDVKLGNLVTLRALPCFEAFTNEQVHENFQSSPSERLIMRKTFGCNIISLIGSVVTLVLISVSLNDGYWWDLRWPVIVLISVNVSLLSRSLNGVLYEAITRKVDATTAFQALLFSILESIVALVGFIGACTISSACSIVGGVGLLCIYAMKFWQYRESACEILKTIRGIRGNQSNECVEQETESLANTLPETEAHEQA